MDQRDSRTELYEAIDACRPGSDDLDAPEMRELAELIACDDDVRQIFERSQRLDENIGEAIRDVTIPDGIEARVLLCLAAGNQADMALDTGPVERLDAGQPGGATTVVGRSAETARRPAISKWVRIVGAAAALSILVVAGVFAFKAFFPPSPIPFEALAEDVHHWVDQAAEGEWAKDWTSAPDDSPASSVPAKPHQWQRISTQYDARSTVYDLTPPGKPLVFHIIVHTNREFDVPTFMPRTPQSSTGGVCIGACQRGGALYILYVVGGEDRYQRFVEERLPVI